MTVVIIIIIAVIYSNAYCTVFIFIFCRIFRLETIIIIHTSLSMRVCFGLFDKQLYVYTLYGLMEIEPQ